jgi:glycosyltransferase involved in cell wall biosynthesis
MAKKCMKIAFATDGVFPFSIGGIQRYSRLVLEKLGEYKDLEITVIHPHLEEDIFGEFDNITEVKIADIDTSKNYLKECYRYSKRVHEVLSRQHYDIVYAQGLTVWYKIKEFKGRLINNPHGLESFQSLSVKDRAIGIPFRKVQKYIFKNSDFVCSEGGWLTEILESLVSKNKVKFVPNAINIPEVVGNKNKPDVEENLIFFFIARFASNKGIHILMQAIEDLNKEGYEDKFQFKLGGKGPLYEEYKEKYKISNVEILGFVSDEDLQQLYAEADVFIFPTLFEGMPTVVLEAMSHHLPVIVSNTGATRELVNDENGYLLEPGNVEQLKAAMKDFYKRSQLQKNSMSNASFERVNSKFTWKRVAERHVELFHELSK